MKRRTLIKGILGISTYAVTRIAAGSFYGESDGNMPKTKTSTMGVVEKNQVTKCGSTPQESEGPFYPRNRQQEHDIDLTIIKGRSTPASGKIIIISGHVVDEQCQPIPAANVEIWQANAWGKYNHPRDKNNPSRIDPNFQGWGVMMTNDSGYYQFKTIVPGAYPVNPIWTRPPHIHFKVSAKEYVELTTQLYFAGQSLNEQDQLLMRLSRPERERVITRLSPNGTAVERGGGLPKGQFNIVLKRR
ncbi:MAG: hypothetical protein GXP08_14020 [Gammaproteobacteria bacterium]|nr:hypothetical protein [Gammaproteobacteria bacterium]